MRYRVTRFKTIKGIMKAYLLDTFDSLEEADRYYKRAVEISPKHKFALSDDKGIIKKTKNI